ncbi:WG repeat-containing protein [Mucilaginibacter paludis]|uniref:WG repeat-containing protein n=1 Tax=Mucilaginibacter paludis TaxID=423351 RepID=UPI0001E9CF2A|nr:WG repeat-containing protein [Mucilaginibacter paludis]
MQVIAIVLGQSQFNISKNINRIFMRVCLLCFFIFITACNSKTAERKNRSILSSVDSVASNESYQVYRLNGKSGLLDLKGNVILQAQFDYIEDYSRDDLIRVDSGGHQLDCGDCTGYVFKKYGLITTKGKILFRPVFEDLSISDHSARVKIDSLYGYIE